MSRKNISKKKFPNLDPLYQSYLVGLLISKILKSGKKNLAQKIVYESFDIIKNKLKKNPLYVFEKAIRNICPFVEVKTQKIGGATYQVPVKIQGHRSVSLSLRWIIKYSREKFGRTMSIKLASEIIDAANLIGNSVKKKEEIHKIAEANKASIYF